MQSNVLCIYPKSAKYIIDIRRMSVFECPGDSLTIFRNKLKTIPVFEPSSLARNGQLDECVYIIIQLMVCSLGPEYHRGLGFSQRSFYC